MSGSNEEAVRDPGPRADHDGERVGPPAPARASLAIGARPRGREGQGPRLRALIDTLFDAYYDYDIENETVDFSAQLGSFLGIDSDRLDTIAAWAERIHPDERGRSLAKLAEAVREMHAYDDEYRMRRADGTYAVVRDRGVPIRDESGRAAHMVGVIRDTTIEREAERALRESAELYETLFEQATNPAFHVDRDGRYVNTNEAGALFLESSREELVGHKIATHWRGDVLDGIHAVISDEQSAMRLDAEVRVRGATKAAIATLVPCRVGGELACFVLAIDITERQRLARTLEESNIALRVILEQRNRSREELERTIATNVESVVLPLLDRVAGRIEGAPEAVLLDTAIQNLREIARPFAPLLDSRGSGDFTRREREIANLIRAGKSTAEIAQSLYISTDTVSFHRKNIRAKLGLDSRGKTLTSYLAGLRPSDGETPAGTATPAAEPPVQAPPDAPAQSTSNTTESVAQTTMAPGGP